MMSGRRMSELSNKQDECWCSVWGEVAFSSNLSPYSGELWNLLRSGC